MIVLASVCRIDATKRHPQAGAYGLGVLTVTHAILVEQDFADIFLPAAKLCNYIAAGDVSWGANLSDGRRYSVCGICRGMDPYQARCASDDLLLHRHRGGGRPG